MITERESLKDGSQVYALNSIRADIERFLLLPSTAGDYKVPQISESPSETGFDYGVNLVRYAKELEMNPQELGKALVLGKTEHNNQLFETVESTGPFINFRLRMPEFGEAVTNQILAMGKDYGKEQIGHAQKVVVDLSSPNIAKRMTYGHLRSTIIGDSIANLYRTQGCDVIRDNHLGDWGTQFGKLIVAIKKWGSEEGVLSADDPIGALQELYVRFHTEADQEKEILRTEAKKKILTDGYSVIPNLNEAIEAVSQEIMTRKQIGREQLDMEKVLEDSLDRVIESDLEAKGREWFLKLEKGDPEARRIWKMCVDMSMKEFNQMYEILGVHFEIVLGESFYEDMLQEVIDIVRKSAVGKDNDGALVIDMQDKNLGVGLVQKKDGASLYFTRDLAGAIYRERELKADKAIYVVGEDQKQYFQQVFEALRRLGYKLGETSEHVYFGMVSLPEGKMSTRKGRVIHLKDVINEGMSRAENILKEKNPALYDDVELRAIVVRQIAIGALKWNDLSQDPKRSIVFDWNKALNFEGNSAPYVQYTAVRAASILEASGQRESIINTKLNVNETIFSDVSEKALIRFLASYPQILSEATISNNPSKVANYVYQLAKRFNTFYTKMYVLKAKNQEIRNARLKLTAATYQVIQNSLSVLGIEVPEKM